MRPHREHLLYPSTCPYGHRTSYLAPNCQPTTAPILALLPHCPPFLYVTPKLDFWPIDLQTVACPQLAPLPPLVFLDVKNLSPFPGLIPVPPTIQLAHQPRTPPLLYSSPYRTSPFLHLPFCTLPNGSLPTGARPHPRPPLTGQRRRLRRSRSRRSSETSIKRSRPNFPLPHILTLPHSLSICPLPHIHHLRFSSIATPTLHAAPTASKTLSHCPIDFSRHPIPRTLGLAL
jgi:hypothetical protein